MTGFINYLINGISLGSVYAIIALGYTMVYGIAKMLNFAHGDIIMVGSYVVFITTHSMGMPVFLSVLLSVIVCTVLGIVIERVAYKPLRDASPLSVLITAIGVSYFLQNAAQLIWSSSPCQKSRASQSQEAPQPEPSSDWHAIGDRFPSTARRISPTG